MSREIQAVYTPDAPEAKGPYSQAMRYGELVFVAGQLPLDPATGQVAEGGFQDHVRQAIRNVEAVLKAAGSGLDRVVRVNAYLTHPSQFPLFNEVYEQMMPKPYPARTARVVELGPYDVEIDATAIAEEE